MMRPAEAKRLRPFLIQREDGFTLNEILISIALIAIGVIGFSVNTMGVIQGNQVSASYTIATTLAQDKMEQVKAQTSLSNVTNQADSNNPMTSTSGTGGIFNRTWTIADSSLGSGLKEITVTVSWTQYLISREVKLMTLVFTE